MAATRHNTMKLIISTLKIKNNYALCVFLGTVLTLKNSFDDRSYHLCVASFVAVVVAIWFWVVAQFYRFETLDSFVDYVIRLHEMLM